MDNDLALLHEKIDRLTEIAEGQRKRQEQLEELAHDMLPIANQAVKLTIDELAELRSECGAEDLLFLLKRVLRDTCLLNDLLGKAEAAVELMDDVMPLSKQMVFQAIDVAEQLEAKGYFRLARGGYAVVDKLVANTTEDDLHALAESIAALSAPPEPVSLWQLMGVVFDARMRQGLGRMLKLVKGMAG